MAVVITDNRVIPTEADAITGWTASSGVSVFTTAPTPVESTASLGTQVSNALEDSYFTIAASDLSDTLIYCWLLPGGVLDDNVGTASGDAGIQIYVGDGTNNIGYAVGGSNQAGFRHETGPVPWQCFVVDTGNLPATFTTYTGAEASLNLAAVTRVGNAFRTLAKSVGGIENCFIDMIAYGNGGLTITGGGPGTEGKFLEIAQADRSEGDHPGSGVPSATGAAYGICREVGAEAFGLQGQLIFGDSVGTLSVDFADTSQNVAFEDRNVAINKYGITITGNATGTTSVELGLRGGTGLGTDGCRIAAPSGIGAFFNASSANIDTLGLYALTLEGFDQGVTFPTDAVAGPTHEIFASIFRNCSQITVGTTEFRNNRILTSTSTGVTEAAVLLSDTTNVSGLSFLSGGTGHAIEISDSTNSPFTFADFTYTGYAGVDGGTGNEALINTSGQPITINVTGGDTPSVDTVNSTGTVTIINTVSVTITVVDAATNPIENAVVAVYNSNTDAEIANDESDVSGVVSFSANGGVPIYIRVRKSTTGSTRYIPVETIGNTGSGLALTITLNENLIVSA